MISRRRWAAGAWVVGLCLVATAARAEEPAAAASLIAKELVASARTALGKPPSTIMLSPFRLPAGDATAGEFMTALARAIVNEQGVALVDRESLNAALGEAMVGDGPADGTLNDVAGAFGADALIAGSVDVAGEGLLVNARVILVTTGAVIASAKATVTPPGAAVVEAQTLEIQLRRLGDRVAKGLEALDGDLRYQQIAVLPFEEIGATTKDKQLGLLVAAELTTNLRRDHGVVLVERAQLSRVVDELALGQTGLTDPAKTVEVGKLAGAQGLVIGTVAEEGAQYSVNAKIVSVADGQVKAADQIKLPAADLVSLSSEAVVLRTTSGAIYRSILMPGWGQFYNRQAIKGGIFVGAEVLAAGLAVTYHLLGNRDRDRYAKLGAGTPVDRFDELAASQEASYSRRNWLLIGLAVVHAANILDAFVSSKSYDSALPGGASGSGSWFRF